MTNLKRLLARAIALAVSVSSVDVAHAAARVINIRYSPDVAVNFSGTTIDDEEVALDDLAGSVALLTISGIPSNAEVSGFHFSNSTSQLLAFDTTVGLSGLPAPGVATPADVVSYNTGSANYTFAFQGAAAGIPNGVAIDGLSVDHLGRLLLSFDTAVDILPGSGVVIAYDEDVVSWNGGTSFTIVFDGSASGVSEWLDVDGIAYLTATRHYLISFDNSGSVGGVPFDDEDVLEYALETDAWSLAYNGGAAGTGHAEWAAADLVALDVLADSENDGVDDASDNCPSLANANQDDVDSDLVGDLCDNCLSAANPRGASSEGIFLTANPWATLTGGQRDDDHDGYGNRCDAKFPGVAGALVGSGDLTQFRASNGKNRTADTCGTTGTRPCAIFDLDESALLIGTADLIVFRLLNGKAPGPKCTACPLPCAAGTSGTCAPVP